MQEALEALVGPEAKGLSVSVVSRLKDQWHGEYVAWRKRPLDQGRWLYWWVDGIYSGLRAERQRLCLLVIIGLDEQGKKHFVAIEDGVRESTQRCRAHKTVNVLNYLPKTVQGKAKEGCGRSGWRHSCGAL